MKKIFIALFAMLMSFSLMANENVENNNNVDNITLSESNTITIAGGISLNSISEIQATALEMHKKLMPKAPIYLVIDSGGGSIQAGLELINFLAALDRPVHTVTIFGGSMAFHTAQNLTTRYILRDGTMMSHKARGGFGGEFPGQLDSRYSYYLKRITRMNEVVVNRTSGKHDLNSYDNLVENEYWCDGSDCISEGFADKVANVSCDTSLAGTKKEYVSQQATLDRFGNPRVIEVYLLFSKCPLITGVLGFNADINGKPVFSFSSADSALNAEFKDAEMGQIIKNAAELTKNIDNRKIIPMNPTL